MTEELSSLIIIKFLNKFDESKKEYFWEDKKTELVQCTYCRICEEITEPIRQFKCEISETDAQHFMFQIDCLNKEQDGR